MEILLLITQHSVGKQFYMNITQRQAALVILGTPPLIGVLLLPFLLADAGAYDLPSFVINTAIGLAVFGVYWRYDWGLARPFGVTFNAVQTGLMMTPGAIENGLPISLLIPPVLSLVICAPPWIVINGLLALGILYGRFGVVGGLARPDSLLIYGLVLVGLLVGRLVVETERRKAEKLAQVADERAQELAEREEHLAQANDQLRDEMERREQVEAELRQSQKMEAIGQLAGGVAHDFNNLLVPIIGYATLGLLKLEPDHKLYSNLEQIKKAAERAADLTRQILAFSRKQILQTHTLNLNDVILDFQKMVERLIGEDVDLQTQLQSDLPLVRADKTQIEQILLNLAVNARDAMPRGGKLIVETAAVYLDEIYLSQYTDALEPGHYVMVAVSDTGLGMDAKTRERIFEPFFTTKGIGVGTGLGLSTAFGIIKQHRGHVWVYSEVGRGTTFKIYLPVTAESELAAVTTRPMASLYGKEMLLVVEDEEIVRNLVEQALVFYGYEVLTAAHPAEGLALLEEYGEQIDLVVTDVIMPGMNGREFYQRCAAVHPDLKVLFMSGYTDDLIAHHGVLDEETQYVQKPFAVQDLAWKVRETLELDLA